MERFMRKFLGFTLAEGATHVALCNDGHSYLRHWYKAFTHVALCNDVHSYLRHWCKDFTHVALCTNKRLFVPTNDSLGLLWQKY